MSSKTKTTATKEGGKPALVPKLRFPEFRAAEGWHDMCIADIAVSESSSLALNKLLLKSEGYPVYGADSCVGLIDSFDQADDYIAIVKDGSGVGRTSLKRGKTSVLGTLAYIKCKPNSETNLIWLYYCLNSLELRQFIKGSGIPHIYFSDYASHEILVPTPAEQTKIAECLSSVDDVIASQARKLDALKTYKKGLMQVLFPREGESQPRLRFTEFQDAGEWAVKPLGEFVELQSGFAFSSSNFGREGRKLVTPKNFTKLGHGNFDESVSKYTTEEVSDRFVCKPGDLLVLLTDLTPTCELLGKPLLLEEKDGTVLLNQRVVRVETSESKVAALFLKYVFLSDPYNSLIIKTATGSTVKHSSNKVLMEMPLIHPSLEEQHRIATCLSTLDDLISVATQKLEALKTYKRGLMQQLFPSPEEVET